MLELKILRNIIIESIYYFLMKYLKWYLYKLLLYNIFLEIKIFIYNDLFQKFNLFFLTLIS